MICTASFPASSDGHAPDYIVSLDYIMLAWIMLR